MRSFVSTFSLLALTAACGAPQAPTPIPGKDLGDGRSYGARKAPECADPKAQSRPLVVDWESSERADIEARAQRGMVIVRADGCKLEVLKRCSIKEGAYDYLGLTPKTDKVVMRDTNELYANVPVYAASLEGKLEQSGALEVAMVIVGQWDTPRPVPSAGELSGDCSGATHVVTALTVGAFEFSTGASTEASASASAFGAGAGGKTTAKRELLNRDGEEQQCRQASADDKKPPFGCGAVLRLEVVPLGTERKDEPTCAAGTAWDGAQCVAVQAGKSCAEGMLADKEKGCVPKKAEIVPPRAKAPVTARGVVAVEADCADVASCQARCEKNDARGCLGLGGHLRAELQLGKPSEAGERAAAAFQKACDAGLVAACTALGEMRYQALGVAKDKVAALALFKKACEGGDLPGCNDAGIVLTDKGDHVNAAPYYERACNDKSALGCVGLGVQARYGRGRSKDPARAKELFDKACKSGLSVGCKLLADH